MPTPTSLPEPASAGASAEPAPRDLRSRKIQVRFDRKRFGRAVVYFNGERMGDARPVDYFANDRKPSAKKQVAS